MSRWFLSPLYAFVFEVTATFSLHLLHSEPSVNLLVGSGAPHFKSSRINSTSKTVRQNKRTSQPPCNFFCFLTGGKNLLLASQQNDVKIFININEILKKTNLSSPFNCPHPTLLSTIFPLLPSFSPLSLCSRLKGVKKWRANAKEHGNEQLDIQ